MSAPGCPDAVQRTVVVRCSPVVAFRLWTEQIDHWWPKRHSRSGDPGTEVVLEGRLGGRLYERTPGGAEYDWGRVLLWEPPRRLAYHWYLGSSAELPTRVDVQFVALEDGRIQIDVTHRGPELLGERWASTSPRFVAAWEHVLAAYVEVHQELEQEDEG
jgi:uncharacterized protein YndB with AHSA1/START domain